MMGVYEFWLKGQGAVSEMAVYDLHMQSDSDMGVWVSKNHGETPSLPSVV